MPLPYLATLTVRARRLFPIVERGVREGLSANAILRTLRADPPAIRRQTLLEMVRKIRNVAQVGQRLSFLRRDLAPDPRNMPEALTKTLRAFSFRVRLRGVAVDTNESIERFVTVALDKPITRAEIEEIATGFIEAEPEFYKLALSEVLLFDGVKSGALGTLM